MAEETLVVLTTWPDMEKARAAARVLVEEHLAACANLLPGAESIYRWEGKVETAAEVVAVFKTTVHRYWQFERRVQELHPYQVPEIVALRPHGGLPAYMRWVEESCIPPRDEWAK
jgi:periplasmic divalent cation tolerance protein